MKEDKISDLYRIATRVTESIMRVQRHLNDGLAAREMKGRNGLPDSLIRAIDWKRAKAIATLESANDVRLQLADARNLLDAYEAHVLAALTEEEKEPAS